MRFISLRILQENDIELVRKWRNSSNVASYMYNESVITKKEQKNWFKKINNENSSVYWVVEYEGKKLGLASITQIDRTLNSCYWAFYLGDLSLRGAGIGAKIEYNVLDYVFNELKINKLRCEVFETNDKVIKMHEKFGFRREAFYREHCVKNNKKLNVIGLAILQSEWALLSGFMKNKIYGR